MTNLTIREMFAAQIAEEMQILQTDFGTDFSEEQRQRIQLELEMNYFYSWQGAVKLKLSKISRAADRTTVQPVAEQLASMLLELEKQPSDLIYLEVDQILTMLNYWCSTPNTQLTSKEQSALRTLHQSCKTMPTEFQQREWFVWLATLSA